MQLAYSTTSPYVRRVAVTVTELGLDGRVERISVDNRDQDGDYASINPLLKVPSMILDDGTALIDSTAIAEFLDMQHDGPKLFSPPGEGRVERMQLQVLVNGMQEASTTATGEMIRRPESLRWDEFLDITLNKVRRGFGRLDHWIELIDRPIDYAVICVGVLCAHVDFRLGHIIDWRAGHPRLADWYAGFAQRPSMQETAFHAPAAKG
ncbi:MAG: glutathione S-transferase family protein [Alphaproteobacteria bacterium]